jgi:hypothetical protein
LADELTDGGGVDLLHLLRGAKRGWRHPDRVLRQREDLKEEPVKGNEVFLDEGVSGHQVVIG